MYITALMCDFHIHNFYEIFIIINLIKLFSDTYRDRV